MPVTAAHTSSRFWYEFGIVEICLNITHLIVAATHIVGEGHTAVGAALRLLSRKTLHHISRDGVLLRVLRRPRFPLHDFAEDGVRFCAWRRPRRPLCNVSHDGILLRGLRQLCCGFCDLLKACVHWRRSRRPFLHQCGIN